MAIEKQIEKKKKEKQIELGDWDWHVHTIGAMYKRAKKKKSLQVPP